MEIVTAVCIDQQAMHVNIIMWSGFPYKKFIPPNYRIDAISPTPVSPTPISPTYCRLVPIRLLMQNVTCCTSL